MPQKTCVRKNLHTRNCRPRFIKDILSQPDNRDLKRD